MRKHKTVMVVVASIIALVVAGMSIGQPQGGRRQGGPGRGGFGGDRNPEEMRRMFEQRMAERMKEQLEITDAEWKVIQPRLKKVTDLTRQSMGGGRGGPMMGMFGRGRGPGGRGPGGQGERGAQRERPEPQNEVQKASMALRDLLGSKNPSTEALKAKLAALRSAREKAKQDLVKAQGELRQLLTLKQEASLVMMGIMP